jgi:hypothetical protein
MSNLIIKNASQVVTCSGFEGKRGKEMSDLSIIENGTVIVTNGLISHILKQDEKVDVNLSDYHVLDASGRALLPGFVDPHIHFVFGGYQEEEFSWRMRGDSYMEIMNWGRGILSTTLKTREASEDELIKSGNNAEGVVNEMIDFDRTIKVAFDYADKNPGTLVVITADHETGGMALTGGSFETGEVKAAWGSTGHTSVMVPVFSYGTGAEKFAGIYENIDIYNKIMSLYGFKK